MVLFKLIKSFFKTKRYYSGYSLDIDSVFFSKNASDALEKYKVANMLLADIIGDYKPTFKQRIRNFLS